MSTFRVLSFNASFRHPNGLEVATLIDRLKPDFVCLIENLPEDANLLRSRFPHVRVHEDLRRGPFGIALASRFPILSQEIYVEWKLPLISIRIKLPGGKHLDLTAVHLVPTAPKWSWHLTFGSFFHRLQQIKKILEFTRKGADTHILLGDFNVTTWMPDLIPVLRHYTDALKFLRKDAPTYYFIRPIRIDYILTRGVKILDGETVITPFSDHNAIWIQFEI